LKFNYYYSYLKALLLKSKKIYMNDLNLFKFGVGDVTLLKNSKINSIVFFFVARSGSTLLAEVISKLDNFGSSDEWFNLDLIKGTVDWYSAQTLTEYIFTLRNEFTSQNKLFSSKVSAANLKILNEYIGFNNVFGDNPHIFYLRRKDIILQAISLYIASMTGVFHAAQSFGPKKDVSFDLNKISFYVEMLLHDEKYIDEFIINEEIDYVTLFYEDFIFDINASALSIARKIKSDYSPHKDFLIEVANLKNKKLNEDNNDRLKTLFLERADSNLIELINSRNRLLQINAL
jgi:LPS sulfotransferase NodH